MNLLRRQLRMSRKLATLVVLRVQKGGCRVRPLPSQQEEAMKTMKTFFGYLLMIGASVVCSLEDMRAGRKRAASVSTSTHHNETSADEAQVVCYCVSIILSEPDRFSDALVALLMRWDYRGG